MGKGLPPKATFRDLTRGDVELQVFGDRIVLGDLTVLLERVHEVVIQPRAGLPPDSCDLVVNISDREPLVIPMGLEEARSAQGLITDSIDSSSRPARAASDADEDSGAVLWEEVWHSPHEPDPTNHGKRSRGPDRQSWSDRLEEIWRSPAADPSVRPKPASDLSARWEEIWRSQSTTAPSAQPEAAPVEESSVPSSQLEEIWRAPAAGEPSAHPEPGPVEESSSPSARLDELQPPPPAPPPDPVTPLHRFSVEESSALAEKLEELRRSARGEDLAGKGEAKPKVRRSERKRRAATQQEAEAQQETAAPPEAVADVQTPTPSPPEAVADVEAPILPAEPEKSRRSKRKERPPVQPEGDTDVRTAIPPKREKLRWSERKQRLPQEAEAAVDLPSPIPPPAKPKEPEPEKRRRMNRKDRVVAAQPEATSTAGTPIAPPRPEKPRRSERRKAASVQREAEAKRASERRRSIGFPDLSAEFQPYGATPRPSARPVGKTLAPRRRSRLWIRLITVVIGLVALVTIFAIVDAYREAYAISRDVRQSVQLLETARSTVGRGEVPASQLLGSVETMASQAQDRVRDARFTFGLVGHLPLIGRPVDAVRLAADAADEEASAAQIMSSVLRDLFGDSVTGGGKGAGNPPAYRNGRVNLGLVAGIVPQLSELLLHLQAADADIRDIRSVPLMPFVAELRAKALEQSASLIKLTEHAVAGAQLLPSFFGANGAQSYLLVLQDLAALAATNGRAVAYGTLTINDGVLSLSDVYDGEAGPLADRILVAKSGTIPFQKQARGWSTTFRTATGKDVDGVIAIDPFAISALLQGRPPTRLTPYPGLISSRNVVTVIQEDIYLLSPERQHALSVALLTESIRALKGPPDVLRLMQQISGAAANLHIELWSASSRQQGLIKQMGWDGASK